MNTKGKTDSGNFFTSNGLTGVIMLSYFITVSTSYHSKVALLVHCILKNRLRQGCSMYLKHPSRRPFYYHKNIYKGWPQICVY